jgi:hypothetical protein
MTNNNKILKDILSISVDMPRFIRFSKIIVNTTKIATIDILPTKYTIFMSNNHFEGWFFVFSGTVESIEICKNKHPLDYKIMEEWINISKLTLSDHKQRYLLNYPQKY